MKTTLSLFLLMVIFASCQSQDFKNGDIVFQTSKSSQSKMIQVATNSKLTHCGIIFYIQGKPYVFEAVQPVKVTPLKEWINRGVGGKYIVSRVKEPLTNSQVSSMLYYAKKQLGKNYDIKFQWTESKMYCSELVYKVFVAGDHYVAEPKTFADYNYNNKLVQSEIEKRYGKTINMNEPVVTPVDIYKSSSVRTIYSNY